MIVPSHFVGLQCEIPAQVAEKPSLKQASASIFMVLWSLGGLWAESGRDYATARLAEPEEMEGRGGEGEQPVDASQTTVTGLAEAGRRLGPAKHFLNAL